MPLHGAVHACVEPVSAEENVAGPTVADLLTGSPPSGGVKGIGGRGQTTGCFSSPSACITTPE